MSENLPITMPKAIEVNGIQLLVDEDKLDELRDLLKENVRIDDYDDWSVYSGKTEDFKYYTAETLLDAANKYFNLKPADLIQAAEKLWLAAVFSVKKLFLSLKVHLVSHSALKIFCKFALNECSLDKRTSQNLYDAWMTAESLHSFSYGGYMHTSTFDELKKEVENFVRVFSSIDPDEIKYQLDKFIDNPTSKFKVEKKSGQIMVSGTHFSYQYRCY